MTRFTIMSPEIGVRNFESDEEVYILLESDIKRLLEAQRKACSESLDGYLCATRNRRVILETPLAMEILGTLT